MIFDFAKLSEDKLILLVQNTNDHDAFSFLVAQHEQALLAFLIRFTGSESNAADVSQETLIKAYMHINKYGFKSSFRTWLFGIAYKEFLQSHRKASQHSKLVGKLEESYFEDCYNPNSGNNLDIQAALNKLTPDERAAVLLSSAFGMTHLEIAKTIDAPLGTVKTYIRRAKNILSKRLLEN